MWWCFKPSKTVDRYEDDDEELAKGIQESWNLQESLPRSNHQQEKLEPTREGTRVLETPLVYDEEAHIAEALKQSLEEENERKDEQVKNDEKLAKDLQYMVDSPPPLPPRIEKPKRIYHSVPLDVVDEEEDERKQREEQTKKDEMIAKDFQNLFSKMERYNSSLKDKGKGKKFEDEQVKKDEKIAKDLQRTRLHDESVLDEEDKSLMDKGKGKQTKDEVEEEDEKLPPPPSICGGCNLEIEPGRSVNVFGSVLWHPECLQCDACHKPTPIHEVEKNYVSNSRGKFHKSCYERFCYICKEKKMRKFYQHPFWKERYCHIHETDGTPKCCSCERLEPRGTNYVILDDGRRLCLECMESSVMDSDECQPLHFEIREYFEGLNMKIEKQFPFLLVEKQALNKAEKQEKIVSETHQSVVTRGICLSEAQPVMSVSKAKRTSLNIIDTEKESQRVVRDCEVTAILILYGLPRLLTGYILAHEMMHAYLRLKGYRTCNKVVEEGICQVLGHMWLESQTYATTDTEASSSSSSAVVGDASETKKGEWSDFEKKLVEFCKYQIETDESRDYGDGFRIVNKMVMDSNLQETLQKIIRRG